MKNEEHELQVLCVNWFWKNYPDVTIYANPNGGDRKTKQAKNGAFYCPSGIRIKKEGGMKGVADLLE